MGLCRVGFGFLSREFCVFCLGCVCCLLFVFVTTWVASFGLGFSGLVVCCFLVWCMLSGRCVRSWLGVGFGVGFGVVCVWVGLRV